MDVLLVWPPFPCDRFQRAAEKVLPLGIAYLISVLRKRLPNVNVQLLDAHLHELTISQTLGKIMQNSWDVIGISFWTSQANFAYELSNTIRSVNSNATIIHGGVHPTFNPDESLKYADFCVLGEGEETLTELLTCLMNESSDTAWRVATNGVDGIGYRSADDEITINPPRSSIQNLDDIPLPAWDAVDVRGYQNHRKMKRLHFVGEPYMPIICSRGCPYHCSYCASPVFWRHKVRYRSIHNVLDEIKWVVKEYGINCFYFWDDNLMLNRKFIANFCDEVIEQKLNIKWCGLTAVSHINKNPQLLKKMREAGCVSILIGIESADPVVLVEIEKGQTVSEVEQAIINQRNAGLTAFYTHMAFLPRETIEGYYQQKKFFDRNFTQNKDRFRYIGQFATPYVGTKFFHRAWDDGIVTAKRWEDYNHGYLPFVPFSLLEDIPVKVVKNLRLQDYAELTYTMLSTQLPLETFYSKGESNISDTAYRVATNVPKVLKLLHNYYAFAAGKSNIREISQRISSRMGIEFNEAVRIVAFITYLMAQSGLVRSSHSNASGKIHPTIYNRKNKLFKLIQYIDKTLLAFKSPRTRG